MRNILFIYLLVCLFNGCNDKCHGDEIFKEKFFYYIGVIEDLAVYEDSIKLIPDNMRELEDPFQETKGITLENTQAILFFDAVTGIVCPGYNLESYVFIKDAPYRKYLRKWKRWYKNNKCTMTMAKADSLIFEFNNPPKPIDF